MDVHDDKISPSNSHTVSSLNENEQYLHSKSEMNENEQCLHSKPYSILDKDSKYKDNMNERNCESDVICQISGESEVINDDSCKLNNRDSENSPCDHGIHNQKDKEPNLFHQDPYDDSKSSKGDVSDELLKDFEYNTEVSEDSPKNKDKDILSNSSEEIPDKDNSQNSENTKSVLLEDRGSTNNLNKNNNEVEIQSPHKTSETQLVHQIVKGPPLSCANTTTIPTALDILDKNICSDENVSKYQSIDTQESININTASRENNDKSIVSTFEANNIESSDTSALMKLAELACETNDTVASEMNISYDNTLKVNETDSPDKQNSEAICNMDVTALGMENDENLPVNFKSDKEFFDKNTSESVKSLTQKKPAVVSSDDSLSINNDSSDKYSKGDNAKLIDSKSETKASVTENLEEGKVHSPVREANNSTPGGKYVDQEILGNFHALNETDENTNINLIEFAGKRRSLLTENVCNLPQNCNALNIVLDKSTCVKHSDINKAIINLEQQEAIKIPQSKLNLGDIAKHEQKGKLLCLEKKANNENLKEMNSFPESEDLVVQSKICMEETGKSDIIESNISVESQIRPNNETILSHNNDPSEQPDSLNTEDNFEIKINQSSVSDDKLYLPVSSVNIKNVPDTHCIDVGEENLLSHVYCEKQETNKDFCSKVSSEDGNKVIKNYSTSSKENMSSSLVKEPFSHSSPKVLDQKSVMEQQNSHSSVIKENSDSLGMKQNLDKNIHSSGMESSLKENSHSLGMNKNLEENSKNNLQDNSHSSEMKNSPEDDSHTSGMKNSLEENSHSLTMENSLEEISHSHSPLMENNIEENSHSHSSLMKNSIGKNSLSSGMNDSLEENSHSLRMKISLEENSHSSEKKNSLCSSVNNKSKTSLIKDTLTHASNKCTSNKDMLMVPNTSSSYLKESTSQSKSVECNSHLTLTESSNSNSSETNSNSQYLINENRSHTLETENNLQSSAMENYSHSSDLEVNLSSSVIESNSHSSEVENNPHPSVKENGLHYSEKENNLYSSVNENGSHSSDIENHFYSSMKEKDSHSSGMENNLCNSVSEKDSHSLGNENNVPFIKNAKSHSSELETDSHFTVTENTLHSICDENPDSSVNLPMKEHTQIVSNGSSSCPKIYIRKDLHEGYSCEDSESVKNSLNENNNSAVKNVHKTSIKFTENGVKRTLSVTDENAENCSKRLRGVLDLTCSEESSDEDKLIIDEERTNLKYKEPFRKRKNPKEDYTPKNANSNSNIESSKNQNSDAHCNVNSKSETKSLPLSNTSNLKPIVEVVDLVGDELKEDSTNKSATKINYDKNYICEKCKNIWNDKTLKLLFEGNESVTVNSRITYGAIICMNIYVSIHYPKIKEQALLGLLDRADLAKNLGSIQVSLLNNWLVALIKNRKISCCDPFRPVYRAKTPNQVHQSDNLQIGNKDLNDKQRQSVASSVKERNLGHPTITQTNSAAEIIIDDDNDINQEYEERNVHFVDSEISLASGKYHVKKVDSCLKTISTIPDSKSGVITNGKAFTKQFAKSNPISYSIIQRERESLSSDLHDAYNKLVYESKLTEEEAITGKRKILTNKEILCMHSIFILNAKEILLDKYYRFLFQLLYHRGNILLIPDEKSLVQRIENIRKERNRMKFSVAKNKAFLSQSWDFDNICTAPVAKPVNRKNEFNVKVQDILSVFCAWKNRKLLNGNIDTCDLREEVLKLYENKIEINDCFGLCIKLYANYSRLLFSQNETENMKTKVFLSLYYLPNKYLSSLENTLIFDPEITYFPPTNGNSSDIIDYLEKQTKKGNGPVKRSYLDSVIDAKLQQAKKLKTDLLNSVKTPKTISLIESYAKLKNEMNYLEIEPANHQSFKSVEDSQEENLIKSLTYTPEVKLMVAKLRASNVDTEYIPIILEKVFHNILKRKIPTL